MILRYCCSDKKQSSCTPLQYTFFTNLSDAMRELLFLCKRIQISVKSFPKPIRASCYFFTKAKLVLARIFL